MCWVVAAIVRWLSCFLTDDLVEMGWLRWWRMEEMGLEIIYLEARTILAKRATH